MSISPSRCRAGEGPAADRAPDAPGAGSAPGAASLVLAPGWFRPRRVVEASIQKPQRLRLLEMLERGSDFERVTYEALPD